MELNDSERQELEELRAMKARMELTEADRKNPKVLLLEGQLADYEGEYFALSVKQGVSHVYLCQVLDDIVGWSRDILTFQYHISSEPLGFYELEEHMIKTAMGATRATFSHAYSDLTGYLWTNEAIDVGGHDLLKEINEMRKGIKGPAYIAMRVEKK